MNKTGWDAARRGWGFGLVALPMAVLAQTAAPLPNAGSVLQQVQPAGVEAPKAQIAPLEVAVPRAVQAPSSGGPRIEVKGFRLRGLDEARAAALLPLVQKYTGPGRSLADLEEAAKDVEVALQREGLFLAQVYVPEQNLSDGIVLLQVLPGRIGAVKVEVEPGVKVDPAYLDRIVEVLRGAPLAERDRVERALFVLGDLRGIAVQSTLTPGDKVGHADLAIKVSPARAVAGSVEADNGGSIYTGEYRLIGSLEGYGLLGRGDIASLKAQVTTNGGAAFVRGSWLAPVNALGTKVGIAASHLRYQLGGSPQFDALDAHGTASALSLQLLHPQVRSRNANLFLAASTDRREFVDEIDALGKTSKKRIDGYYTAGLIGDWRDTLGGGGISNVSATLIGGRLVFRTPDDALDDAGAYRTAGRYTKLVFAASRLQLLPNKDHLYLQASGQWASKDLDSSEKFSLGGPNGVRAYPSPDTPSDQGAIASWEYRRTLPSLSERWPGDWVLGIFGDYGWGRLHDSPRPGDPANTRRLSAHGVGLTYAGAGGFNLKATLAVRGNTEAQTDDARVRAYVLVGQSF